MSKTSTRTTMAARAASALLLAASAALAGARAALLIGCGQRGPLYLPARPHTTPPSAPPPPPAPAARPPPPPPPPPPRHTRIGSVHPPLTEAQTTDQAQAMPRCLIHIKRSPQRHRTVGSHFELYLHERHRPP